MKMLSTPDFFAKTMGGRPNQTDMLPCEGHPYKCPCGTEHEFKSWKIEVLRELGRKRLVFECPDDHSHIACVKRKGWFRFKGFETLFGTKMEENLDQVDVFKQAVAKRTGMKFKDDLTAKRRKEIKRLWQESPENE